MVRPRPCRASVQRGLSVIQQKYHLPAPTVHPREGEQGGGLNPPDPLGIPWGRKFPADISFSALADPQWGHFGAFLSEGKNSSSNSRPQSLQTNSNIGIVTSPA